jgi:hypothetical protein
MSIFLSAQGKLLVQLVTEKNTVEGSQCLVRADYSAINLCDYNFFYMGLSSFITGFEMSGTVEAAPTHDLKPEMPSLAFCPSSSQCHPHTEPTRTWLSRDPSCSTRSQPAYRQSTPV